MKKELGFRKLFFFTTLIIILSVCIFFLMIKREKKQQNDDKDKTLWSHMVFIEVKKKGNKIIERNPVLVYGLFNQLFSLFCAVDLAKELGRKKLFISKFYVNVGNNINSVPVSKIIDLSSLNVSTSDWCPEKNPTPSELLSHPIIRPVNSLEIVKRENHFKDLEVSCCFNFPVPFHIKDPHVQNLRFHPIFYDIIAPFLKKHPQYQVVHYRMENDFTEFFFHEFHFNTLKECREYLYIQYQNSLKKYFDPKIPTLVVSHYYKDPNQVRDYNLQWDNLVHFRLNSRQKQQLYQHLELPVYTPIREVEALIDFMLCTSSNVCDFIGCGGSTFSESVKIFRKEKKCFIIQPIKL